MYLGYYSFSYLWLILPALLLTIWAQFKVKSTFKKYSQYTVEADVSGEDACRMIQQANGISIPIQPTAGELTDYYDPRSNSIHLSQGVYDKKTIAAIGVAAHETGHALQYAENYAPIRFRMALVPMTNFASGISPYLIMLGLIAGIEMLSYIGIALFSVAVLFQLVTLPVEFNASSRAVAALAESGRFSDEEIQGVKKVLSAAALTYVAALLVSLANLLRLILITNSRGRRRR